MARGPQVARRSAAEIQNILDSSAAGLKGPAIAKQHGYDLNKVYRVLRRDKAGKLQQSPDKGGRPKKTSPHDDRKFVRYMQKHPKSSVPEAIRELNFGTSAETGRRRLHAAGIHGRKPARKPLMSYINKLRRVKWCKTWSKEDFKNVLFTDEKKWVLVGRKEGWVWRCVGARYKEGNTQARTQAGGGSVMVWGAISRTRTYPLIVIDTTIDAAGYVEVLKKFFGPPPRSSAARKKGMPWTFMHDNASIHAAKLTEKFLKDRHVEVLPWPANSPDLNPIENLWSIVSKKVYRTNYSSRDALIAAVQTEWAAVTPAQLAALYDSMPRRMAAVVKGRGGPTAY
jgi:transposase